MRQKLKDAAKIIFKAKEPPRTTKSESTAVPIPDHGCVQVLPIMWRQKLKFGVASEAPSESPGREASETADQKGNKDALSVGLEDITLDTVQSIRMLVSDVVLDVLLYMTPKYRQEMLHLVTDELNRIYKLYKERNPHFNGKVSIYGHSLGSLLAFDVFSNQKVGKQESVEAPSQKKPNHEVDLSDLLSASSGPVNLRGVFDRPKMRFEKLEFEVDAFFGRLVRKRDSSS